MNEHPDTQTNPAPTIKHKPLKQKRWLASSLITAFVLLAGTGILFNQNSRSQALLQSARAKMTQGDYSKADTLLTSASRLLKFDDTKQQIEKAKTQNKQWQADASKLEQGNQLFASNKLDEAAAALSQIDKTFPAYTKVTALQNLIHEQQIAAGSTKNTVPLSGPIQIVGDAACQTSTQAALRLLGDKAPTHYAIVKAYVGIIECTSQGSGMYAYENPPRYLVGDATINAGTIWYAGTIAHDAGHSKLYNDYKLLHPGKPVPDDVWTGETAEKTCLDAQFDALTKIGGTQYQLDYVKNGINTQYYKIAPSERWW